MDWLFNKSDLQITEEDMLKWLREDKPNNKIEEEINFCDKDTLQDVINGKVGSTLSKLFLTHLNFCRIYLMY